MFVREIDRREEQVKHGLHYLKYALPDPEDSCSVNETFMLKSGYVSQPTLIPIGKF